MWEAFVRGAVENPLCGLPGQACRKALKDGLRPPLSPAVPTVITDLIERCWAFEPTDRPTAKFVAAKLKAFTNELVGFPTE